MRAVVAVEADRKGSVAWRATKALCATPSGLEAAAASGHFAHTAPHEPKRLGHLASLHLNIFTLIKQNNQIKLIKNPLITIAFFKQVVDYHKELQGVALPNQGKRAQLPSTASI